MFKNAHTLAFNCYRIITI